MRSYSARTVVSRLLSVLVLSGMLFGFVDFSCPVIWAREADEGKIAYIGQDHNVWLVNADGSETRQITFDAEPGPNQWESIVGYSELRWSPDGRMLGFSREDHGKFSILVMQMSDFTVTPVVCSDVYGGQGFDWLPDSRSIVFSDASYDPYQPGGLSFLDLDTGTVTSFIRSGPDLRLTRPDWAPVGDYMFFSIPSYVPGEMVWVDRLYLAQAPGGTYIDAQMGLTGCDWSPNGQRLVCCTHGFYGGCSFYNLLSASGTHLSKILETSDYGFGSPIWSPNGKFIAYGREPLGLLSEGSLDTCIAEVEGNEVVSMSRVIEGDYYDPLDWSPDGSRLLALSPDDSVVIIDIATSNVTEVAVPSAAALYSEPARHLVAAWQPAIRGPSIGDFLTRKEAVLAQLEESSVDIVGLLFPVDAFDETAAMVLVQHIHSEAESDALDSDQVDAFARVTLQEEGLAELLPLYSQTSANLTEAGTDVVGILLSLNRGADRALQACYTSGNPFSGACLTLRRLIERQVFRIFNSFVRVAIRFIPEPQQQEEFRQFWSLLANGVSLELDAGNAVQDILLSTVVKGPAVSILVHQYVEEVQPSLDQGVRSADPTYAGSEPTWIAEDQIERAELHTEGIVEQAAIQAEYAHSAHRDLMRGADMAQFFTDIADIGRLSPWAALAQIVRIAMRVEHLLVDAYAIAVNVNSMNCTRYLSARAGSLAFNPNQPGESCRDLSSGPSSSPGMARESSRRGDATAWEAAWSRVAGDTETYEDAVIDLLTAMSSDDPEAVTEALTVLDEADQALAFSTGQAMSVILDSDVADSKALEALSQTNQFSLDALELYLLVASYVTAPEDERSITEVEQAAGDVLSSLGQYSESLQAVAPTGTEDRPLPVVQAIVLPDEVVVEEPFEVAVAVRNVGSACASAVAVKAQATGQEVQVAEIGTLDANQTYTTTLQTQASHTGTLTLLIEVAMGDSVTDSRIDQVQVGLESPEEETPEPRPGFCAGLWGLIALPVITAVLLVGKRLSRIVTADIDHPEGKR